MRPAPLALAAALSLALLGGCSQRSKDDTTQAADSIAADANTTMARAVNSVDAASDKAFGSAQRSMDDVNANMSGIGNSLDRAGDSVGNAADRAGDSIGNAADRASHATGRALKKAGDKLDQ